jgi:hypothetical protein
VILFMLFYGNHPLEGKKVVSCPCMTEANERKYFGSEPLFLYDRLNKENLPVRGVHQNVIKRWPLFTKSLQEAFIEAFSHDLIINPTHRMIESRWERIISQLRNVLILCSNCGNETFVELEKSNVCINCNKPVVVKHSLKTNNHGIIALSPKKKIIFGKSQNPIAVIRANKSNPSILAFQNLTSTKWIVEQQNGTLKEIAPNEILPLTPALKITFSQHDKGEIV